MQSEQAKSEKTSARRTRTLSILAGIVFWAAACLPAAAFPARVDLSACRGMYHVLRAMRSGAPHDTVTRRGNWAVILVMASLSLAVHLLVNAFGGYGYFRDELYYIACSKRLAAGYVDQPPLGPAVDFPGGICNTVVS